MTAAIAAVTTSASLLILLTGSLPAAATQAGFVAARIGNASIDQAFALPIWLIPLTATLVHGGIAHLGLNMLVLVFCGKAVERVSGAASIGVLYGLGAYAGAAVQWVIAPDATVPMIGASGAISAIIAAYARLFGERRPPAVGPFSADVVHVAWLAAAWIGIQLLMGITGFAGATIAIGAHIGGFVVGLFLARPLLRWHYRHA